MAGVGGVGEAVGVADHGGVEDDFAAGGVVGAKALAGEGGSVLED